MSTPSTVTATIPPIPSNPSPTPPGTPKPIIEANQLSLWYGSFQALDRVSFEIQPGEVVALIGPSGCGKSTLLRCLNRMNDGPTTRTEGSLKIDGTEVLAAATDVIALRRDVGMVFQRPNPLPLSIRENVLFGLHLHARNLSRAEAESRLESALRTVDLWELTKDHLDTPAGNLSLEARQKLCIARLLPVKPAVLLMDEPCSALDPAGTAAVEALMRQLQGTFTQVIVTHNMQQARRVSSRCMFMWMGQLVEFADTETLFTQPIDPRTANYVEGRFG
jgi:phosphate transport system ATP-binding protein